jgi:hypothetical protein
MQIRPGESFFQPVPGFAGNMIDIFEIDLYQFGEKIFLYILAEFFDPHIG